MLAMLAALFWAGVPIIMLASDYRSGGISEALAAVQAPEYEDVRVLAFYIPAVAFMAFCSLGLAMVLKRNFSLNGVQFALLAIAFVISVYSSAQGHWASHFGLAVCVLLIWKIYVYKKNALNKAN